MLTFSSPDHAPLVNHKEFKQFRLVNLYFQILIGFCLVMQCIMQTQYLASCNVRVSHNHRVQHGNVNLIIC